MKKSRKPSAAETAILNILWEKEPCSVKVIHEALSATKTVGYTTTLKQVQRLHEKGLLSREPGEGKSFNYRTLVGEDETKSDLFNRFVEHTFGDSVSELVMHALGNEKTSKAELEEIKNFIENLDKS